MCATTTFWLQRQNLPVDINLFWRYRIMVRGLLVEGSHFEQLVLVLAGWMDGWIDGAVEYRGRVAVMALCTLL